LVNIKETIEKTAREVLGKREKIMKKKGLKIWNDEIAAAIKGKKEAYNILLQTKTEEENSIYKLKRNTAKTIVNKTHQESWERFIAMIETDIHGRQTLAYKVMRYSNNVERDTEKLDIIQEKELIEHYKNLWYDPQLEQESNEKYECYNIDKLTVNELEEALNKSKGRKSPGPDGISTELIKYGGTLLKLRFLHLLNL
jgi:hypothetical protein